MEEKEEAWSFFIAKVAEFGTFEDGPGWIAEVFITRPDGTWDETQHLEPGENWAPLTETTWEPVGDLEGNPQAMYEDLIERGGIHAPEQGVGLPPDVYLEIFSPVKDVENLPKKKGGKITTEICKQEIVNLLRESDLEDLWINIDDPSVHETREAWIKACLQGLYDTSCNELETEESIKNLVLNPKNWIRQRKYNDPYWGIVREFSLRGYEDIEAHVHEKDGKIVHVQIERD